MKKKTIKNQGLAQMKVLIQDTTETSSKYFNISELPPYLSNGINSFRFSVDNIHLVKGSKIYAEIIDVFGKAIYHEVPPLLDEANKRIVSIYVYDDTPPGKALITLVGTAKQDSTGKDISNQANNVRWAKLIDVKPNERNNSQIVFKKPPTITITEVFKNISSGSYYSGQSVILKNNDMNYNLIGNDAIVDVISTTYKFNKEMIGSTIEFQLSSTMITEPRIPDSKTYVFTTTIKDVLTDYKLVLADPIIIDTERLEIPTSQIWKLDSMKTGTTNTIADGLV